MAYGDMSERPEHRALVSELNKSLKWSEVKLMAIHLKCKDFTLLTLNQIEESRPNDPAELWVTYAMKEWLQRDTEASWAKIVFALRETNMNTPAAEIEEKFCTMARPHTSEPNPLSQPGQQPNQGFASPRHYQSQLTSSVATPHTTTQSRTKSSLDPSATHSQAAGDSDSELSSAEVASITDEAAKLQKSFGSLLLHTKMCFMDKEEESGKFLRNFKVMLTSLRLFKHDEDRDFLKEEKNRIMKAKDVNEIFDILEPYWNYVDYDFLEHIINEFGTSELKEEMKKYIADLEQFEMKTTVHDFSLATQEEVVIPVYYRKLAVKLEKNSKRFTLHDVRQFKNSVANQSSLEKYALLFEGVSCNSVDSLAFPPEAYAKLSEVIKDKQFRMENKVVSEVFHDDTTASPPNRQKSDELSLHHEGEELFSFNFGPESPPLTDLIASVLRRYPDGGQIMKELIQNADDTGASEVHFFLDMRKHSTEDLLARHQGPALYAWNNAKEDWKRLAKIEQSSKEKEVLKSGRFGFGFSSVFHITDMPMVISKKLVGITDPHKRLKLVRQRGKTGTGVVVKLSEFMKHKDHASCLGPMANKLGEGLDEEISEVDVEKIAHGYLTKWEGLRSYQAEVTEIRKSFPADYEGQKHQFLCKWRVGDATYRVCIQGAEDADMKKLAVSVRAMKCQGSPIPETTQAESDTRDNTRENIPACFSPVATLSQCTHDGGCYHDEHNDFGLEIPAGAIPEGESITIDIGVALYGPFQYPEGLRPVSPVFWVCVRDQKDFQFLKPVKVTIPHCLDLENHDDIESLGLTFLKGDHEMNPQQMYQFQLLIGNVLIELLKTYAELHITHFCCLCFSCKDTMRFFEKANFCLYSVIPEKFPPDQISHAYFYTTLLLKTCLKTVENQIENLGLQGYKKQKDAFQFSTGSLKISIPRSPFNGWMVGIQGKRKILRGDIDFFVKRFSDDIKEEMEVKEKGGMYPPRFHVVLSCSPSAKHSQARVEFKGAVNDLVFDIILIPASPLSCTSLPTSPIGGEQKSPTFVDGVKPQVPDISPNRQALDPCTRGVSTSSSTSCSSIHEQHGATQLDSAASDNPRAKPLTIDDLFDVKTELIDVAERWKDVGLALRLHNPDLNTIDARAKPVIDCLTDMLELWLNQNYNVRKHGEPSWQMLENAVRARAGGNNAAIADQIHRNVH